MDELRSYVIDRHGNRMKVQFDKITSRMEDLAFEKYYGDPLKTVDPTVITQGVVARFSSGMTTRELDELAIQICREKLTENEEYEILASRIAITNTNHKISPPSIFECMQMLITNGCTKYSTRYQETIKANYKVINDKIEHRRDFRIRYFGFSTIQRYLIKAPDSDIQERPQHMYMRVALSLMYDGSQESLQKAFDLYDLLSLQKVSLASPIMLNSGTKHQQMSSCFLLGAGDSIESIYDTLKNCALISKRAGGIGVWISSVRADGSLIKSTGGISNGIRGWIRQIHECQQNVNQGGLRPGAFAIYLEPWHADIFDFLNVLPRIRGDPTKTAPHLKYALWVSDNFMRAVENNDPWYLMSPDECPNLYSTWGKEFEALYDSYVEKGLRGELRVFKQVNPSEIMKSLFKTMREVGTPYISFKDNVNRLSNMNNVATIASSNLCNEVIIPSWSAYNAKDFKQEEGKGEIGVCNLGAVCLASYVNKDDIDFEGIVHAARILTEALDNVIDINDYPVEDARRSNMRHRPIGIGIMGLADVFAMLKISYGSKTAQLLDRCIASAIYYGACSKSADIASEKGSYPSFLDNGGSPASRGLLQPDLWVENGYCEPGWEEELAKHTGITAEEWDYLRIKVTKGLRNAYLTAYMPTASTSIIVGQNESHEPFTSNMYTRNTMSGEFVVVNRYLVRELKQLGLWNSVLRDKLVDQNGSVQNLDVPNSIKQRYRIAQEIDQRILVLHSAIRGPFVCQSQSLNFYYHKPTLKDIQNNMLLGWKKGLKTGSYYIHSDGGSTMFKSALKERATSVASEASEASQASEPEPEILVCRRDNPNCESCSL